MFTLEEEDISVKNKKKASVDPPLYVCFRKQKSVGTHIESPNIPLIALDTTQLPVDSLMNVRPPRSVSSPHLFTVVSEAGQPTYEFQTVSVIETCTFISINTIV